MLAVHQQFEHTACKALQAVLNLAAMADFPIYNRPFSLPAVLFSQNEEPEERLPEPSPGILPQEGWPAAGNDT